MYGICYRCLPLAVSNLPEATGGRYHLLCLHAVGHNHNGFRTSAVLSATTLAVDGYQPAVTDMAHLRSIHSGVPHTLLGRLLLANMARRLHTAHLTLRTVGRLSEAFAICDALSRTNRRLCILAAIDHHRHGTFYPSTS